MAALRAVLARAASRYPVPALRAASLAAARAARFRGAGMAAAPAAAAAATAHGERRSRRSTQSRRVRCGFARSALIVRRKDMSHCSMASDYKTSSDFCRAERGWLLETAEALVASNRRQRTRRLSIGAASSWRRGSKRLAGASRGLLEPSAAIICWRNSGCGSVADPAARSLRHGLAGRPARAHAARAVERPAARPRRVRHEGGDRHRHAGDARAARSASASLSHRIVMLWTTDEEIGSETSRAAIEEEAARSAAVLVLEPSLPGGALKTSRKGCGSYQVDGARRRRARRASSRRRARAPCRSWRTRFCAINALQDLARGISVNVVQVTRRAAVERHPGRGACHRRRARADGGRRGGSGGGVPRSAARRRADDDRGARRVRPAAAGTQ